MRVSSPAAWVKKSMNPVQVMDVNTAHRALIAGGVAEIQRPIGIHSTFDGADVLAWVEG